MTNNIMHEDAFVTND